MCADDGTSHRGGRGQPRRAGVETVRDRRVVVRPFLHSRRLVTAAVRAGHRVMPMQGLFIVDITTARSLFGSHGPPLSLAAFVVASIGRAAAAHSEVHAYRDWRGRLVEHRYVDVQTLIEIPTSQGPFGLVQVVRDADIRSVADISAEIRAVKADSSTTASGRLLTTLGPALGHVPGLYPLMYAGMSRSRRVPPRHRHRPGHRGRHVRQRRRVRRCPTRAGFPPPGRRRSQPAATRHRGPGRTSRRPRFDTHHRPQRRRRQPSTTKWSTAARPPDSPPICARSCAPPLR